MITNALDALTTNHPSEQQVLVKFVAEWAVRRFPRPADIEINNVWYLVAVLFRYSLITRGELPTVSPKALKQLVNTILSAWQALAIEAL